MNYLINYAHNYYKQSQRLNSSTGLTHGRLDSVIECAYSDLSQEFIAKNNHILSQRKGAGYWLWKPYIIVKALENIIDGDVLFYSDSGAYFIKTVKPLIDICKHETDGVMVFHMEPVDDNKEVLQTKKDAFVLMNCDTDEYRDSWARLASFSIWVKNDFSINIAREWLRYCEDERILTDIPNSCGIKEDSRFISHRHDQSVFSLLTKKYKIKSYPDPSQWGNGYRGNPPIYEQMINHTRNKL